MREHRPRDLSATELGFRRQRPVAWLNPGLLIRTGVRVGLAYALGSYLDKRELQAALPGDTFDHTGADELWLDFTADGGDGFDATYSIAYLMAPPELAVDGADGALPRGELLVLGGDQVYPAASARAYDDRWKGPYRAALPASDQRATTVYALPGNHDWYDGLTSFLRVFAQQDPCGGWQTAQHRSYFALELPHRWWVFAMDIQLESYIDEPQLDYFTAAAERLEPGDRVILVTARPAWVVADAEPDAYDNVDYFVRKIITPTGARVPLLLAGDRHHYSRYAGPGPDGQGRQLVTCGGAGAFASSTADLPKRLTVPPPETVVRQASEPLDYDLEATYPRQATSRRLAWRIFDRLPRLHPGFPVLLGFLQTLLMLALMTADGRWFNAPIGFAVAAVVAGTYLFAVAMGRQGLRHRVAGVLHAVPHIALGIGGAAVWSALPFIDAPPPWGTVLAFVIYLPVVGLIDTWLVAAYLLVASRFGVNNTELAAGLLVEDYKSFLRLHLGADGEITLYPVGVRRVGRRWRPNPDAPVSAPWIVPERPIPTHHIEPPVPLR